MGKGRDKRKKAKGSSTAGHGAAKTEKKTQQNEQKKQRRGGAATNGEDDIDAILAALDRANDQKYGIKANEEIILFGGEFWDQTSNKIHVYDDLYKYNPGKSRWTHIRSPGPQARSACAGAVYRNCLYIFGGEFTSPNQEKFRHFRDLWRLDLSTWEWDELKVKGGPSARSGHRMLCHKGVLYLFGGFHDTGVGTPEYFADLWAFSLETLKWETLGDMREKWPVARSAFQWVVHDERLVMHGGYTKETDDEDGEMEHGRALGDTWAWRVADNKWERIPRQGMAPSVRSSFGMVLHKNKAIMFGGATDEEAKKGEVLVSSFFNDLYQLNLVQGRWYPVAFRLPRTQKAKDQMEDLIARVGKLMTDKEASKDAAATCIQAHYRGHVVRKAFKIYKIGGAMSEVLYSPAAYGVDLSSRNAPKPRARINANMCVVKNVLWLFGGIVEIGDKEVTLDDLWKLDLVKLDGWVMVKDNTAGKEDFEERAGESPSGSEGWESDGSHDETGIHLPKIHAVANKP